MSLQPSDISDNYTLEEIDAEIVKIKAAIDFARESKSDQFNDMQAGQKVSRQKLSDLNDDLAIYLKARSIKTGSDSATADLIAANYNPARPII